MTREEYQAAVNACHNGESYCGDPNDWNKDYRSKLEKHGLMLTYAEPRASWYIMTPVPIPQADEGRIPILRAAKATPMLLPKRCRTCSLR